MIKNANYDAYASIEKISSYENKEALVKYRNSRLVKYQSLVNFLTAKTLISSPISVVEIGSGSSALLYALVQKKLLRKGLGIELSQSRYQFAELWKLDDSYDMVQNVNANFTGVDTGLSLWDWFIIIDNTFTYLHPEDVNYPTLLLSKAYQSLKKNGRLLIDFFNYSKRIPEIDYRQWQAYSKDDPYSYGLYSQKINDGINCCESIFIRRNGSESRKLEYSKTYTLDELSILLESCGFSIQEIFSTFNQQPFIEKESERLVIVANKIT